MKTYSKYFQTATQSFLTVLFAVIIFFGMNNSLHAQSPVLGNDFDKINNSMKIQMNKQGFDVLIPKVQASELSDLTDASYNQMVYVTDENPGFYIFANNKWTKYQVREMLAEIELNLHMGAPSTEDMIIEATVASSKQMLDYNGHIRQLYSGFTFEKGSNQMAVLVKR
ncbi:hypothetical protein JKA74_07595 [Marivirga sp. S37H4]|uniref:Uncharacterized protein n=1 Tax=Marivirga aurantiaca TaxID=2802615 RepID=A0A935C7A9_9BACT|nr:hypothetical protein [Marivirga aurantiaca]MBK6264896.1 hypothetical protein [Marivirga aurantiaca]